MSCHVEYTKLDCKSPDATRAHASNTFEFRLKGPQRSATAANATPLRIPGRLRDRATHSSLHNTVQRQWDSRISDLGYQDLLKHRRNEKLTHVDRYVPDCARKDKATKAAHQSFPFDKLPQKTQDRILSPLLVIDEPINIDFTWPRPFVKGHARIPVATQKLQNDDWAIYLAAVPWTDLLADVKCMNDDMTQFQGALEIYGTKTRAEDLQLVFLTPAFCTYRAPSTRLQLVSSTVRTSSTSRIALPPGCISSPSLRLLGRRTSKS